MTTQTHETDVLIIGSGGAGLYAAITAWDQGAKVMVVSKSLLGRGGCSAIFGLIGGSYKKAPAGAKPVPLDPAFPFDKSFPFADKVKYLGNYLVDQEYAVGPWAWPNTFYHRMEEFGLYIRRHDDGTLVTAGDIGDGRGYGPISPKTGTTGKGVMDAFRSQIFKRRIPVLEESMGVTLIESNGRVGGAIVYDFMHGVIHEIRAKAVILACGHVNNLWKRTTATREQAGNGLAMAFNAGAELAGIEIIWWHIADMARPNAWTRSHMHPNSIPMTMESVEYYNSNNELFFNEKMYNKAAQPCYYLQCKHLLREIHKGLARTDGGYYASFKKIDPKILDEFSTAHTYLRKLGLDPQKDMMECAMSIHQMRGGVAMDHSMATRVEGLFVAGSLAADFITGIQVVCWEAEVAATAAVRYAKSHELMRFNEPAKRIEKRLNDLLDAAPAEPIVPSFIKHKIRELMSREMDYIKNADKIQRAVGGLRDIRENLLPHMHIPSKNLRANFDLVDALDVPDMLDVCELICIASLNRKESRASFYRTDYPVVDNKNWLKNIYLSGDVSDPDIRFVNVNLKYTRPADETADFVNSEY